MQQWEYFSVLVDADTQRVPDYIADHFPNWQVGRFSPLALIPYLNDYGAQGWELISAQPVANGTDEAILMHNAAPGGQAARIWTHTYLCIFKRARP